MSFALRTTFTRVPRAIVQIRGYADKTMTEQAGDMLKKVGQAFKSDGAVGEKFNADGAVGSKAEAVGGPFSKDGSVGKQFTDSGAIGGNVEKGATDTKQAGQQTKDSK